MLPLIQSLWVGARLSNLERLAIRSFLFHGHPFRLYVYGSVEGVPDGVEIADANEILPVDHVVETGGTYAGFADFFRYKMLLSVGGWWVDTDTVCLRPFDFESPFIFSSEYVKDVVCVNNGIMRAPAGSPVMDYAWNRCTTNGLAGAKLGQFGPKLMQEAVERFGLREYVQRPCVFCPVPYSDWEKLTDPEAAWHFGEATYAVHFWNEMWRWGKKDKDRPYPMACLFERLKQQYSC
jgi:Alpha 1,4-glycosyltransferase conserved region/Glycosyltransferase sugar-binding region containing DXD motif